MSLASMVAAYGNKPSTVHVRTCHPMATTKNGVFGKRELQVCKVRSFTLFGKCNAAPSGEYVDFSMKAVIR